MESKQKRVIAMLGDSLIAYFDGWGDLDPSSDVMNFGQGGDNTFCVLKRVGLVCSQNPQIIFLQAGINDLLQKLRHDVIINNHVDIWRTIARFTPEARLMVCSLLPVNKSKFKSKDIELTNDIIRKLNDQLYKMANALRINYIDVYSEMTKTQNKLSDDMSDDGIHLLEPGYRVWLNYLKTFL
jgi:lysophospholipase L1-like esterase